MLTKLCLNIISVFLIASCSATKLSSLNNKQSFYISSEEVKFDLAKDSLADFSDWLANEKTKYDAVIYTKTSKCKVVNSFINIAKKHDVKYKIVTSDANQVVLSAANIKNNECSDIGCASSSNFIKMITLKDANQILKPKSSSNHHSYTFN